MRIKHYYILLLATAFLTGCTFDDPQDKDWSKPLFHSDSELVPVTFSVSSQNNVDFTDFTRAETSIVKFDAGEAIKVFVKPFGETSYTDYVYTTDAAGQSVGLTAPNPQPYYPAGAGTTVEAYAYYPATAVAGTIFSVADDQRSDSAYKASDLMFAPNRTLTKDANDGRDKLTMEHQMAQLRISANPDENAVGLNIIGVEVVAKKSVAFTPEGTNVTTTTGEPSSIIALNGAGEAFVLIPPQLMSEVMIKVITGVGDDKIASYGFSAEGSFESGKTYGVDITVTASQVGMTTAIANWNGMGSVVIAPSGDLVITPIQAQVYTGLPITPTVIVKKNGETLEEGVHYTKTYMNNTHVGTAYVVVTGKAGTEYESSCGVTPFKITEATGSILYDGVVQSSLQKVYGEDPFQKLPTKTGDGTITYSSDNTDVATVDENTGEVTLVHPGTAVITATIADGVDYTYPVNQASYVLTVTKGTAEISFATANPQRTWSKTTQENNYSQAVNNTGNADVVYTIDSNNNTCGATINNGTITYTKAGEVTVVANIVENDYYNYNPATASYTLTVKPATGYVTLSATEGGVSYGGEGTFTVLSHHTGGGISVVSADNTIATAAYSNNTVTVTGHKVGSVTITVTCAGTDHYAEAKAEYALVVSQATPGVTAPTVINNLVYNGSPQALLTAGSTTGGTMKYRYKPTSGDWSAWSTSVPTVTNADTYSVQYMVESDGSFTGVSETDLLPVKIEKFQPIGSWSSNEAASVTCGQTITRTFTVTGVNNENLTATYQSSKTNVATVNSAGVVTGVTSGTSVITATYGGSTNYKYVTDDYLVTVNHANPSVTAPTAKSLTYNGSAQALVNAGSTTGGTLQYSLNNSSWSTSIPTGTNAGSYTVYYKVVGNESYNDVASQSVNVTINPKTVNSPTITLNTSTYTYDGNAKTPTPTVKDGSTTIGTSEYSISYSNNTNAGTGTVTISDKSGGNYTVSGSKTFTINKADGVLNLSAYSGYVGNGKPTSFTVSSSHGGTLTATSGSSYVSVSGPSSSKFTLSTTQTTVITTVTITVKCAATTNYKEASKTYSVIVYKVSPTTLNELKYWASAGNTATTYYGRYVNSSGTLSTSTSGAVGRVAYYSSSDVEVNKPGSRILILALSDIGPYKWKTAASSGDAAWNSTSAMNGLQFCASHYSTTYPAAYYSYKSSGISGASYWFMPSWAQMHMMDAGARKSGTGRLTQDIIYWVATESQAQSTCAYHFSFNSSSGALKWWGGDEQGKARGSTYVRRCCAY